MKKTITIIIIPIIAFFLGYQLATLKTEPQKLCEAYYQTTCTKNGELPNNLIPYSDVQSAIYTAFELSSDTFYFENPERFFEPPIYEDEFLNGRCFTPEAEKLLLKYYPKL